MESLRGRTFLILLFFIFCGIYLAPNVVQLPKGYWFHKKPLNYGLDIQGGANLVYGVDVKGVLQERTERMARAMNHEFEERQIKAKAAPSANHESLLVTAESAADREKASAYLKEYHATNLQILSDSGLNVEARYFDAVLHNYREQIINQAIEVLRNRVDEFGVSEPVIAAQGTDRIIVQLPGITDPARAKELINKTAKLSFRLVDNTKQPDEVAKIVADVEKEGGFNINTEGMSYAQYLKKLNELAKPKLPPNTVISFEKAPQAATMEAGKIPYLLRTDTDIGGDLLEDAFPTFDEYGAPKVAFRFGTDGRKQFGELTGANIQRQLAIVLDDVVYSAPTIQSRIDGQGEISLGRGNNEERLKEAQLISTALRAGALPAALQQLEERSVGPSLGADSVSKGKMAGVIGILLVMIFMMFYYKVAGVVASITLGLNVIGLLAVLSALGATLTLPGIAGITLTVGMAVDANVLIFERIREELARGTTMRMAIKDGFDNAWSAIFDSNVTTAIAAAVLIYFGSGPVRGFGVTLIAGIITTVVTAVFVSHWMMDVLLHFSKKKTVAI